MMFGLAFVSCSEEKNLKAVLESAEKDGANWSEEEWREAFKVALKAAKPMLEDMKAIENVAKEQGQEDRGKKLEELVENMKNYEQLSRQIMALGDAAQETEAGRKVYEDKNLQKELARELGMEDLIKE